MKMRNIHPIVASLISQQTLYLAVKSDNSAEFLNDLRVNTDNPTLTTETGRADAFATAISASIGKHINTYDLFNRMGNVAVIPVHGSLINRLNTTWGFVTGYGYIKAAIQQAVEDDTIDKIVLDVNSNGGEAAGCFETAEFIKKSSEQKEIHAVVDSRCFSAAYALSSACTSIIATPSSGVGSIGVVAIHVSYEKLLDELGIKTTFIKAGDKKMQDNPYQDLTDEVKADIQQKIDGSYKEFVKTVANNRGIEQEAVIKTQAACYTSQEAKQLGLIDEVLTVEQAIYFLTTKEVEMTDKTKQDVTEVASASAQTTNVQANVDAAVTERQRIQAITTCEAAQGQEKLAQYFAFNTNMSVEEVTMALNAAKADKQKAEATKEQAEPKATVQEPNYLAQAMAQTGSPNVGADKGGVAESEDQSDVALALNFANSVSV